MVALKTELGELREIVSNRVDVAIARVQRVLEALDTGEEKP